MLGAAAERCRRSTAHTVTFRVYVSGISSIAFNMQYAGKQLFAGSSMPTVQAPLRLRRAPLGTKQTERLALLCWSMPPF